MEHREKCNEEVAKLMLQRLGIEVWNAKSSTASKNQRCNTTATLSAISIGTCIATIWIVLI
jgi:hypothetical protein